MMDWQPIETAPRDERVVLLWCPYVRNLYGVLGEFAVGCSEDRIFNAATHWMPLPSPPDEAAGPAIARSNRLADPPQEREGT
jgi:hypothetical protein